MAIHCTMEVEVCNDNKDIANFDNYLILLQAILLVTVSVNKC